ncbi:hypothetical protein HPB47_012585 [Ixodes persulcatus]|uniref:Uncharacterized protein n=1 Tax=Ixodes persulcatus TaxID=34615 RepID=A0AC60NT92_IXOPE|nr:hypothetical protein HPB47_012585 [Ixodes persulcatus]
MYEGSTARLTEYKGWIPGFNPRNMWAQEPIIPDKAVYSFSTVTLLVLAGALVILGYAAYIKLACEQ